MEPLRLISLNVERGHHVELVKKFLQEQQPDIICLQEVCPENVPEFAQIMHASATRYSPTTIQIETTRQHVEQGIAIISRLPVIATVVQPYIGDAALIPVTDIAQVETYNNSNRAVIAIEVAKGTQQFRVCTTHFTWSPKGQATDEQRRTMSKLLGILSTLQPLVLCGDFNAPRISDGKPGEIFEMLTSQYKDNIPPHYETSIDISLHRDGKVAAESLSHIMADGLFTTPQYQVNNVRLVPGVSDHMAVIADITSTLLKEPALASAPGSAVV